MPVIVRASDRQLLDDLAEYARRNEPYRQPMPSEEWTGSKTDLGVVVGPSAQGGVLEVVFVCLATKGRHFAERFSQATFAHLAAVAPVPLTDWLAEIPSRYHAPLNFAIAVTGRPIPRTTWTESRAALLRLRPELVDVLALLERLLEPDVGLPEPRQRVFADEKDAAGVAVSIAFGRTALTSWQVPEDDAAPWLSGLTPGRVREDIQVVHDASRVPDWWPTSEPHVGIREFVNDQDERLTVMNVNRHDVEEIVGVDLLYYRNEPASFVLVQYKRTAPRRSDEAADPNAVFYPSGDVRFEDELRRMRIVDGFAAEAPTVADVADYRLHPSACWVKLCDSHSFVPQGTELVPGMYLPLDFYDALLADPATLGPKGGRVMDRERLPRWINNTLFIALMSGGWIGSRGVQTAKLNEITRDALEGRRSLVIAHEHRKDLRNRRRR